MPGLLSNSPCFSSTSQAATAAWPKSTCVRHVTIKCVCCLPDSSHQQQPSRSCPCCLGAAVCRYPKSGNKDFATAVALWTLGDRGVLKVSGAACAWAMTRPGGTAVSWSHSAVSLHVLCQDMHLQHAVLRR
jgi:hypothetical protein